MGRSNSLSRRADHGSGKDDNRGVTLLRPEMFAIRALQTFHLRGAEDNFLKQIRKANRDGEQEDWVKKALASLGALGEKTFRGQKWDQDQDIIYYRGKIYVPNLEDLRRKIVERHHDTKIGGHPGC